LTKNSANNFSFCFTALLQSRFHCMSLILQWQAANISNHIWQV